MSDLQMIMDVAPRLVKPKGFEPYHRFKSLDCWQSPRKSDGTKDQNYHWIAHFHIAHYHCSPKAYEAKRL